jgi:hypothetical protein
MKQEFISLQFRAELEAPGEDRRPALEGHNMEAKAD